ncbi:dipeptide epimerase [Parasphingorhabdus sp. DH2-15]|uniref:dipeptide epimerase n=1 Tax=Parasphingorhabdus sp. DH2-15 TaxID=3444112 RepID=UPI003F686860
MITLKSASVERFTLAQPYIMARGAKTDVDVVVCEVTDGTYVGRGEGTPIYFEGETAELCVDAIEMRAKQNKPISRENLLETMMEGAARNAFDCALWDLESKATGKAVWELAGLKAPQPMVTAYPISLDTPEAMHDAAQKAAAKGFTLLKVMLDASDIMTRVAAVRAAAPDARMIVDANESWEELDILSMAMGMQQYGVELIEQPVSAGFEDELMGVESPVPFCADESCHTSEDLDRVEDCFGAININLDKTGGLTEALSLAEKARMRDIHVMAGSMLCTSLGVAPALVLAQKANWVDLSQPALLKKDRKDAATYEGGMVHF